MTTNSAVEMTGGGRRKSTAAHHPWKTLARFPHSHSADDGCPVSNQKQKGLSYPPPYLGSGSFFDENMLRGRGKSGDVVQPFEDTVISDNEGCKRWAQEAG